MSVKRMATEKTTRRCEGCDESACAVGLRAAARVWRRYQRPTRHRTTMASSAAIENQAMLGWPCGMMIHAAKSGPDALPKLPPTWKTDCASPCWPPDTRRAMRDDSGWKIDDPVPTNAAATRRMPKFGAMARTRMPTNVKDIPAASEYGLGWRSV